MDDLKCPNCGTLCPIELETVKVVACPACDTTLFLQGEHVEFAGEQGIMHDAPLLFGIGDTIVLGGKPIRVVGHARYSYGRGFWDEFCGTDQDGATSWITVDEGDVVEQVRVPDTQKPKFAPPFKPGEILEFSRSSYTVTEVESAECIALRGQFDEVLHVGESYDFVNASAGEYALLSGEFWGRDAAWFKGRWYDPFDVKVIGPA